MTLVLNGTTGVSSVDGSASTPAIQGNDTNTGVFFPAADAVAVATGGSERMRVDSAGAMLVGTSTTPSSNNVRLAIAGRSGSASNAGFEFITDGGGGGALFSNNGAGIQFLTFTGSAGSESYTERARIDSSGNLLVGATTTGYTDTRLVLSLDNSTKWVTGPGAGIATRFYVSASNSGGVYLNGTAATSWTAISDERFKTDLLPIENAANKVASLRAVTGVLKSDEAKTRKAFLMAQDVLAVLPEAVDTTNPDQLGLAYTEVIPLLVAAIQELKAELDALKAQVAGAQA